MTDEPKRVGRANFKVDDTVVGVIAYAERGDQEVYFHVEVDDEFAGMGVESILSSTALQHARARGKRVVAACSAMAEYVRRNPSHADIVNPVTPEIEEWLRSDPPPERPSLS